MRAIIFLLLFIIILSGALVALTPLGFVLGQSGAGAAGVGWAKVDGTLLRGRVSGLYVGTQPIGDVSLNLRPASLLGLRPTYNIQWGGAGGRGTAALTLARNALIARDVRAQQDIGALEGLAPEVRAMGGSLRLADGAFALSKQGCTEAAGTVSTTTLSTFAAQYGREFGELSGPVSCRDGVFGISMNGQSPSGDRVEVQADAALTGAGQFEVSVETRDTQIILALSQIGFIREDGAFVYRGAN